MSFFYKKSNKKQGISDGHKCNQLDKKIFTNNLFSR